MTRAYRYTILLDREANEDWGPEQGNEPDFHDGSDTAAIEQVAREMQEAMDQSGLPAGFFKVVKREKIEDWAANPINEATA